MPKEKSKKDQENEVKDDGNINADDKNDSGDDKVITDPFLPDIISLLQDNALCASLPQCSSSRVSGMPR